MEKKNVDSPQLIPKQGQQKSINTPAKKAARKSSNFSEKQIRMDRAHPPAPKPPKK